MRCGQGKPVQEPEHLMATATKTTIEAIGLTLSVPEALALRAFLGQRSGGGDEVHLTDEVYFALKSALE